MKAAIAPARILKSLGIDQWLPRFAREPLELLPNRVTPFKVSNQPSAALPNSKGKVGFVVGCVMPVMFGQTHDATAALLRMAGFEVVFTEGQGCCGALFAHGGNLQEARSCARRNIAAFEKLELDAIIINAAGCGSTLKEYAHLLDGDAEFRDRAKVFSGKIKDVTEFLVANGVADKKFRSPKGKVTYHDACHLAHAQRITLAPRQLVKAVAGPNFVELSESDVCCGSAGSYNLTEPRMAERLQKRKIGNIVESDADILVTSNPGCILQIESGLRKAGHKAVRVMHIADFLLEHLAE
jgi:glycolate oxidase iron-sulfur subunit